MAARTEVYHAWRRTQDSAWECVAGVKGSKLDALRMVETLERMAYYEDYEYIIMEGDARPRQEMKMRQRFQ